MIYVTHDQVEAMTMGDRIVIMNNGEIQQVGGPMEVYDQPINMFVAGFIGSPVMNFFQGKLICRIPTSSSILEVRRKVTQESDQSVRQSPESESGLRHSTGKHLRS